MSYFIDVIQNFYTNLLLLLCLISNSMILAFTSLAFINPFTTYLYTQTFAQKLIHN